MKSLNVLLIMTAVAATGCASARLKLDLDLYDGDPGVVVVLSAVDIQKTRQTLYTIEAEADTIWKARTALAEGVVAVVEAYMGAFNTSTTIRESLPDFYVRCDEAKDNVTTAITTTRALLYAHAARRPGANAQEISLAAEAVLAAMARLSAPFDTDLEESVFGQLPKIAEALSPANLKKVGRDSLDTEIVEAFKALGEELSALAEKSRGMNDELPTQLKNVSQQGVDSDLAAGLRGSARLLLRVGPSPDGRAALTSLAGGLAFLYSQIDRLQDAADPVWRTVTAPANERRWNTKFSDTYFYAEGNASVVVARDTPMSFRVQRGTNDPTVLVESQLMVTRAVAGAAIGVAGAVAGIPVNALSDGDSDGSLSAPDAEQSVSEFAGRQAVAEMRQTLRRQAREALTEKLGEIQAELGAIELPLQPGDTASAAEKQRYEDALKKAHPSIMRIQEKLLTVLAANKAVFEHIKEAPEAPAETEPK